MEALFQSVFNFLGVTYIVVGLVEIIFNALWNKLYFTIGLPIYIKSISIDQQPGIHLSITEMEKQLSTSGLPAIKFKEFSPAQLGFREALFDFKAFFRYAPMMHGLLVYNHAKKQVVVFGFANWAILVFICWMGLIISQGTYLVLLCLIPFVGVQYIIQLIRFNKVAVSAAHLWPSNDGNP